MKAKKSFGQNWLSDSYTLDKIVESAELSQKDTVLEVGPGTGNLTEKILNTGAKLIAVEADSDLLNGLKLRFANHKNFELINQDILKFDPSPLPPGYKLVANIPYYLTSNLIRKFLESANAPERMVLLLQKEVAQRIAAGPGDMSLLAFSVQYYARPQYIMDVKKELFDPIPKVDSALIRMIHNASPLFKADTKKLFRLVKAGFGEKRKTLRNSLSGGLQLDTKTTANILHDCGIEPNKRAQELSMGDWQKLYEYMSREMVL